MQSKVSNTVRKVLEPAAHIEQAIRVTKTAKHAVSATQLTHLRTVQHLAKNAIDVGSKIILVLAADQHRVMAKAQTNAEVEHQHAVGALRDVTNPVEADTSDLDHAQGVDHKLTMHTA